jgi:hypothetical protein
MVIRRDAPAIETNTAKNALYQQLYPYYAELCALSEIRKKPGFGVPLRSGIGGHSILYLNGVCRDRAAGYPVLKLCDATASPGRNGVAVSVNAHYRNANWIATDGEDFVWRGALAPGEALTRDAYQRTQERAKALGLLNGIAFHDHVLRDKPGGMSDRDYMYELSIGTDYAARFGRDTYRIRLPLDRARMGAIVNFLNALNAPYRAGTRAFHWRLFNNNCAHVAHNALACTGIWRPWPTGQFFALAALKFPVPKNELVDLALRANDLPVDDADVVYRDELARRLLLEMDTLPTAPGALATAGPVISPNDVYETQRLRLIFYDNPFWGPYRPSFQRIFGEPRYLNLHANLSHFAALYAAALGRKQARRSSRERGARAQFDTHYEQHLMRELAKIAERLAILDCHADTLEEVAS